MRPLHRFDTKPSFERLEENEPETDAALTETMLGISETTFKDGGRGLRSVHAKKSRLADWIVARA